MLLLGLTNELEMSVPLWKSLTESFGIALLIREKGIPSILADDNTCTRHRASQPMTVSSMFSFFTSFFNP